MHNPRPTMGNSAVAPPAAPAAAAGGAPPQPPRLTAEQQLKIYRQLAIVDEQLSLQPNVSDEMKYQRLKQRQHELEQLYTRTDFKVPTVRFGRTELQMPILTLGGMRLQETWNPGPDIKSIKDINKLVQANFQAIVDRAFKLGINHVETARGYGTSEMQYAGASTTSACYVYTARCVHQPFAVVPRVRLRRRGVEEVPPQQLHLADQGARACCYSNLLRPPFVTPTPTPTPSPHPPSLPWAHLWQVAAKKVASEFRTNLEKSFKELQVDGDGGYVDLFSFHGVNTPDDVDKIVVRPGRAWHWAGDRWSRGCRLLQSLYSRAHVASCVTGPRGLPRGGERVPAAGQDPLRRLLLARDSRHHLEGSTAGRCPGPA